ncbi:hypothetical protein [Halotalea alkalilenta]|uniref:hypothetical protein n=1 Tax=Halotalea alkalilenta TaxID=376489 RepID=UPI00123786B2|nr:hypothetical protein [Halotalea alkalilenta]
MRDVAQSPTRLNALSHTPFPLLIWIPITDLIGYRRHGEEPMALSGISQDMSWSSATKELPIPQLAKEKQYYLKQCTLVHAGSALIRPNIEITPSRAWIIIEDHSHGFILKPTIVYVSLICIELFLTETM